MCVCRLCVTAKGHTRRTRCTTTHILDQPRGTLGHECHADDVQDRHHRAHIAEIDPRGHRTDGEHQQNADGEKQLKAGAQQAANRRLGELGDEHRRDDARAAGGDACERVCTWFTNDVRGRIALVGSPMTKRATYSMNALVAVTVSNQLRMNGPPISRAVYLRPMRSASRPAGTAPTRAPMARNEAIQVSERRRTEYRFVVIITCALQFLITSATASHRRHVRRDTFVSAHSEKRRHSILSIYSVTRKHTHTHSNRENTARVFSIIQNDQ